MKLFRLLAPAAVVLFAGCSQTVSVRALQPAAIDRAAQTKSIAVTPFSRDRVGLSGKIESALSNKWLDGKRYFTVISRGDVQKILDEQRLQNSGLFNEKTSVQVGELLGAQALISGDVTTASASDSNYYATRTRCADKSCSKVYEYAVPCTKRLITLAADIRMVDVEKGDIIYADTLSYSNAWDHCSDRQGVLPSREQGLNYLADRMSSVFTQKLTPHYVSYSVELLDDPDTDYSDAQEKTLENALEYIRHGRYHKAEALLSNLLESTHERSYVAAYDLGVVKEVQGDLSAAQQLYKLADSLTQEPNDAIDRAMLRIRHTINASKQAREQMQR
jgi:curli biogenesis system outer membrane secretion channel CsgG